MSVSKRRGVFRSLDQTVLSGNSLYGSGSDYAQSFYGSMVGTMTHTTGAVIPNAQVTVTNLGTNEPATVNSVSTAAPPLQSESSSLTTEISGAQVKMFSLVYLAGIFLCAMALRPASAQAAKALTGLVPQHVTISVEDINREGEWYVRVLGFTLAPPNDTNPDFLNHHLSISGYRIDLIKYKGSSRPARVNPLYLQQGWIHIAFSVPDLGAALLQLQALNTDVKTDKDANGVPARLVVHDPEGNEIEFFKR